MAWASWLPRRRGARLAADLVECDGASSHTTRGIDLLHAQASQVWHQRPAAIPFEVEHCAVTRSERVEIGDSQRETVNRAPFDLHVNRGSGNAFQRLVNRHANDRRNQPVAKVIVP